MEEENNKKEKKKEGHFTRIGPILKKQFEKQKQVVKETTWNCTNPSDYEVGEILGKKIEEAKLI